MEHFTSLEWRHLASACRALALKERERATAIGGRASRDYINSAQEFERLAERCMRLAESK
jgi:hypothetical protein